MSGFGNKVNWPEHWSNGGTGITRFFVDVERRIAELADSVRLFGDDSIYVQGDELHCSAMPKDLSPFWNFHEERLASLPVQQPQPEKI